MKVVNEQNGAQLEMETEGKESITGITGSTRLSPTSLQSGATTKPGECLMGALVNWNHRGILWKLESWNLMEIMHLEYQFSSISLLKPSVGMGWVSKVWETFVFWGSSLGTQSWRFKTKSVHSTIFILDVCFFVPWLIFWYFKATTLAIKVKIDAKAPVRYRRNYAIASEKYHLLLVGFTWTVMHFPCLSDGGKAMERLQLTAAEGAVCAVAQTTRESLQWQLWSFTGQNLVSWMTVFDYTEPDFQNRVRFAVCRWFSEVLCFRKCCDPLKIQL